jgi:hypothetical protein
VVLVRTEVSEEHIASIFKVKGSEPLSFEARKHLMERGKALLARSTQSCHITN